MSDGKAHVEGREFGAVLLAVALLALSALMFAMPSQFWLEIPKFDVLDAPEGQALVVDFERVVHRDVTVERTVKVRRMTDQGYEEVCRLQGSRDYLVPQDGVPHPVYLQWFTGTDYRCHMLPEGEYLLSVTWEINRQGIMGLFLGRTISKASSFKVLPETSP